MLRSLALIVLLWIAAALPALAAKEDSICVQAFLIDANFLNGTADGALGPKSLKAAEAFLERTGLSGSLPALSDETAPQWCAFLTSGQAQEQIELASLTLYDVAIETLPEIDDGVGPMLFSFKDYKLSSKYDGLSCSYTMKVTFEDGNGFNFATGSAQFADGGHMTLIDSKWETGSYAPPEAFNRANLAITDKAQLVGKMPVYHLFPQEGEPLPLPELVTLDPAGSNLSGDVPQGKVNFDIGSTDKGEMSLRCKSPDGPVKLPFDFAPYKLATTYAGFQCNAQIVSRFEDSGVEDPSGTVVFKIDAKGKINVDFGQWMTKGPAASFKEANLGVTRDRKLVGTMDVYAEFPDPDPHPPITVELDGSEGEFDDALKGVSRMKINQNTTALFKINVCRPPA